MIDTITPDTYQQATIFTQRTFPAAPFPRKYVHSVFDSLPDAIQAVQTLVAAGYTMSDIHLVPAREYMEAVERKQTFANFLFSIDYDMYRHEARRGHHILAVHLSNYDQMKQVRDLLAPHHAHLVKYIDTWTMVELSQ